MKSDPDFALHAASIHMVKVIRAKLHGLRVTGADLHYHGSITLDPEHGALAGLYPCEFVEIWNKNSGARLTTYVIYGNNLATTREVYFNESLAPLNTTLVRNDNIIIRIPDNAPFANVPNKLRVVTEFGQAELNFVIEQPGPTIASFDPAFIGAGGRSVLAPGTRPLVRVEDVKPQTRVAMLSASSGAEISGPAADGSGGLL